MAKQLSFTRLDTFEQCPAKYNKRYVERLKPDAADSLLYGSILHSALEAVMRGYMTRKHAGPVDAEHIVAEYDAAWQNSECTDRALYEEGKRLLAQWAHRLGDVQPNQVIDVERKFTMQLAGVTLIGFMDRVDRIDDDTVRVIDYKSSRAYMLPDNSMQLALYGIAAKQMYNAKRVQVAFDLLRHDQVVVCDLTDEHAQKCVDWVHTLATQLTTAKSYPAKLNTFCNWCDYKQQCVAYVSAIEQPLHVLNLADDADELDNVIMATKHRLKELQGMQRAQALHGEGSKRPSVRRSRKVPADKAAQVLAGYGIDLPLSALTIDSKAAVKMTKSLDKSQRALAGAAIEAQALTSNTTVVR